MKLRTEKIKLTDKDKLVLLKHLNVCTDLGGKGCDLSISKDANFKQNLRLI